MTTWSLEEELEEWTRSRFPQTTTVDYNRSG
jgi:Rieske Fe-S protein